MEYFSYQGYEPLKKGKSYSYGDFVEDPNGNYIRPDELSGGDYSNSGTANRSNFQVFLERYGKMSGVYELWGGYGTYAIVIHKARAEKNAEIKADLDSLADYPVLDDSHHCQLQNELEEKAWEDTVKKEVQEGVEELLQEYFNDPEKLVEDDELLYEQFYHASDEMNEYWNHTDTTPYIDLEKIIPCIADTIIAERLPKNKLPLLVAHDFTSKQAEIIFQKRLKGDPEYEAKDPIFTEDQDGQTAFEFFYTGTKE